MDPAVPTVGSYLESKSQAAVDAPALAETVDPAALDPVLLVAFAAVLAAICWQNWVLARRAEGRPLTPDWLRALRSD